MPYGGRMSFLITNFPTLTGLAPVYLRSEVGNVADNVIVLTYNKTLNYNSVPATTDFAVAGTYETIISVNIYGSEIFLTMSGNLISSDILTISYTKGSNPIQDSSINQSVNLVTKSIVNTSSSDVPDKAILTKGGIPILTRDGKFILTK